MSLILITACWIFGDLIISVLYGEKYQGAGDILSLYAVTSLFGYFSLIRLKIFTAQKKLKSGMINMFIYTLLLIGGNSILIEKYGVFGAIYSLLLSNIVANVGHAMFDHSIREAIFQAFEAIVYPFKELKNLKNSQ
jgi:O-antigen/teichoic acid export membrane protein